jgi:hypothetical protein
MIGPLLNAGGRVIYHGVRGISDAFKSRRARKLWERMTPQERRIAEVCKEAVRRRDELRAHRGGAIFALIVVGIVVLLYGLLTDSDVILRVDGIACFLLFLGIMFYFDPRREDHIFEAKLSPEDIEYLTQKRGIFGELEQKLKLPR